MGRSTLLRAVLGAFVASWVAGCATDRLDAAPPSGVNLTGDWALNLNLSDDPDKMGPDPDASTPPKSHGSHRGGRGGGRGGGAPSGMPPVGTQPDGGPTANYEKAGYGFVPVADTPPAKPSRGASINRYLRAPVSMSITQDKGSLTITTNLPDGTRTSDSYTAGEKRTIPFGEDNTAERTAGWRGPVFVVTTSAKKYGNREDDFAIDTDDGRLIMTTMTSGGKLGKVAITRVYDRVKTP